MAPGKVDFRFVLGAYVSSPDVEHALIAIDRIRLNLKELWAGYLTMDLYGKRNLVGCFTLK